MAYDTVKMDNNQSPELYALKMRKKRCKYGNQKGQNMCRYAEIVGKYAQICIINL